METRRPSRDKQSLRWLFKSARPARAWVLLSVGLGLAGGLLLVAQAGLLAHIVQAVFMDRLPRHLLMPAFAGLAVVILLRAALAWGREVAGFEAGARVRQAVRTSLLETIVDRGPVDAAGQRTGVLTSTLLEQVESLHDFFALYLPQLALAIMIPVAILAFVFPLSWTAGLLLMVSAPLIPLFMILVGMGAESISQRNFQALARLSAHFLDTLQGLATLKLFDRSRVEAVSVAQASADYRRQTMRVLRVAFLSAGVLEFFSAMAIALVAVYLGMHYLGYLPFGDYGRPLDLAAGFFILLLAPDFFLPLRDLGAHYHARAEAVGAAKGIVALMGSGSGRRRATVAPADRDAGFDGIGFQGVHFSYDRRRPILQGIDFEVHRGQHVALVGASGAGKTTILNLLMGFSEPQKGTVAAGGRPLGDWDPVVWRRKLAWIGQTPALFFGTVRDNILLGRPQASADELDSAVRAARVLEFCRRLPRGLDTPVGEGGGGLSRGQAQRVALARAFLKDAPLLLLDEPTAGLDAENERLVLASLDMLCRHRTVLMATHRLDNIRQTDRILVLAGGQIAEQGKYAELMAAAGLFYRLSGPKEEKASDD